MKWLKAFPILRRMLTLAGLSVLSACAHDSYSVIPGGPGSQARMSDEVRTCKKMVIDQYFAGRSNSGLITGAVLGGAVGGAIGSAVDASNTPNTMKSGDIDPAIEECMRAKGYAANPDNEP
jgi:hypothetical protein